MGSQFGASERLPGGGSSAGPQSRRLGSNSGGLFGQSGGGPLSGIEPRSQSAERIAAIILTMGLGGGAGAGGSSGAAGGQAASSGLASAGDALAGGAGSGLGSSLTDVAKAGGSGAPLLSDLSKGPILPSQGRSVFSRIGNELLDAGVERVRSRIVGGRPGRVFGDPEDEEASIEDQIGRAVFSRLPEGSVEFADVQSFSDASRVVGRLLLNRASPELTGLIASPRDAR